MTVVPGSIQSRMMAISVSAESEFTLLEPRAAPDGRRLIALGASNPPITLPTKSVINIGTFGPRHISTTGVTLHHFPKEADFFPEFNGHNMVIE
jgi:hypothetical protein